MKDDTQPAESNTAMTPPGTGAEEPPADWQRAMESRLEAVESRLAFQEDWLETLDKLLRDQAGEGERTRQLIALLRERLVEQRQAIDDLGGDTPSAEDERPPHY